MSLTISAQTSVDNSIHQFKVADIYGNIFDFSELKGKKIMIVNTASKCGLTYQYEALQELYSQYKDFNFMIVGFPSNDFLWQEPGNNEDIIEFCEDNYGVTFPMFSKITTKGPNQSQVYKWLTNKELNGWNEKRPTWNFCKYLVNEEGDLVAFFDKSVNPLSKEITSKL